MPRWRQVINPETGKSEFVPIGKHKGSVANHAVHGDIQPFVSPLDGSVISDRKQYREHCERHNVVPAAEFSQDFYERKAAERARLYTGERTKAEVRRDRQKINEIINQLERAK